VRADAARPLSDATTLRFSPRAPFPLLAGVVEARCVGTRAVFSARARLLLVSEDSGRQVSTDAGASVVKIPMHAHVSTDKGVGAIPLPSAAPRLGRKASLLVPPAGDGAGGPRLVELIIVSVRHLPKMDLFGTCDPYVQIEFMGCDCETSVRHNCYDAVFDDRFCFTVIPENTGGDVGPCRCSPRPHSRRSACEHASMACACSVCEP
jgi:hypothetical protein